MMPKVTLLSAEGSRYDMMFGTAKYVFRGGRSALVPVAVAIACKKRLNAKGKPLFKVEEMPTIIEPVKEPTCRLPEQNAPATMVKTEVPRQLVF